jgi:hypothetical protein
MSRHQESCQLGVRRVLEEGVAYVALITGKKPVMRDHAHIYMGRQGAE